MQEKKRKVTPLVTQDSNDGLSRLSSDQVRRGG